MKKLLVAAMGIAAAYGAFADPYVRAERFDSFQVGDKPKVSAEVGDLSTTYWSEGSDASKTNEYEIVAAGSISEPATQPDYYTDKGEPAKALSVKTQFGKPLSFNVVAGATEKPIGDGLYFDSLVKFTVCDDPPTQEYSGAKIVMWLQTTEDESVTNIMINAGYLTKVAGNVNVSNAVYKCKEFDVDVEAWHRVTIKAISDITKEGVDVPAFVVFIDGSAVKIAGSENVLGDNFYELDENATYWYGRGELFPSLVQGETGSDSLTNVGFDGTGKLTDLVFTDVPPAFAKDHEANKATVVIGSVTNYVESLSALIEKVNPALAEGSSVSVTLLKGMTLDSQLAFTGTGTLTLDFAGCVLTNGLDVAAIANNEAVNLVITNSVGNGGIYCPTEEVLALSDGGEGSLTITAGSFWGHVALADGTYMFTGGAFMYDADLEDVIETAIPAGKTLSRNQETGMYEIVDVVVVYRTITFNANDGEGSMAAMTVEDGVATNLTANAFTRTGYTFAGWATEALGSVAYADRASITPNANLTLYAKWNANTYTVKFVYGLNKEYTNTVNGVEYNTVPTLPTNPDPAYAVEGYDITWPTFVAVTADATYEAEYTPIVYTITYKTAEGEAFTAWADQYVAPTSFTVVASATLPTASDVVLGTVGSTFNGWTNAVGVVVTNTVGLTDNLVVFANVTAGSTNWETNPDEIQDNTPASEIYSELTSSALASTDAKKLTVWAKANGKTVGAVAEAAVNSNLYDAYLLNCSEEQLETAKENFKIPSITFDAEGKPVIGAPTGGYNGNIQQKGSNNLSTWTPIDGSEHKAEDYKFFKLELVP